MNRYMTRELPRKKREDESDISYALKMSHECSSWWTFVEAETIEDAVREASKGPLGGVFGEDQGVRFVEVATSLDAKDSKVFKVVRTLSVDIEQLK